MNRYCLEFSKKGIIKYISHLDIQRLFKRGFKQSGIPIEYSQGYNPHPRMGFAQPLSLGYEGEQEYLEFFTTDKLRVEVTLSQLKDRIPEGINLIHIQELDIEPKSLASIVTGAVYTVVLPIDFQFRQNDLDEMLKGYLSQDSILAMKKEKKSKNLVEKDIKGQIRNIKLLDREGLAALQMELDCGSHSNLSPELVIESFRNYSKIYLPREEIQVIRNYLIFSSCIPHTTGLHLDHEEEKRI